MKKLEGPLPAQETEVEVSVPSGLLSWHWWDCVCGRVRFQDLNCKRTNVSCLTWEGAKCCQSWHQHGLQPNVYMALFFLFFEIQWHRWSAKELEFLRSSRVRQKEGRSPVSLPDLILPTYRREKHCHLSQSNRYQHHGIKRLIWALWRKGSKKESFTLFFFLSFL